MVELESKKPGLTPFRRFDPASRIVRESVPAENARDRWLVSGNLSYYVGKRSEEKWVLVPANYQLNNNGRIPSSVFNLLGLTTPSGKALVLFEYLINGGSIKEKSRRRRATRSEAFRVFWEAMTVTEVPLLKRLNAYVRVWLRCQLSFL